MNKVKWEVTQRGLTDDSPRLLREKIRIFTAECELFGGLNFLEFIQYLVYRNHGCNSVWVNDELVWNRSGWHDDFLLIKVGEVPPTTTKQPVFKVGHNHFDREPEPFETNDKIVFDPTAK